MRQIPSAFVGRCLLLLIAAACLAAAHFAAIRPKFDRPVARLELAEARAMQRALWIDGRGIDRYRAEHIPGALPLNLTEWESLLPPVIEAWTPGTPVIVYCDGLGCDDARGVATRLRRDLASDDIYVLSGGLGAWRNAGLALSTSDGGTDVAR